MTIHNSKGLESKVVFVTDLFSAKGIITLTNESQSRLIVSPEFFAGHPAPWPGDEYPISAMWEHAKKIAQKRKNAEARRLLYVAATRAEEHLVIVGLQTTLVGRRILFTFALEIFCYSNHSWTNVD